MGTNHTFNLEEERILSDHSVQTQAGLIEHLRAEINKIILTQLQTRENHDQEHFGKMQTAAEKAN